jgi:hypothetical protein
MRRQASMTSPINAKSGRVLIAQLSPIGGPGFRAPGRPDVQSPGGFERPDVQTTDVPLAGVPGERLRASQLAGREIDHGKAPG